MDVSMLLCDAAQEVGGKLYILGGGWSLLAYSGNPVNMALAIKVGVPWDQTNKPLTITVKLMTEDGAVVDLGEGEIRAEGKVEVGRPAGLKPGTTLDLPIALAFSGLTLEPGGYRWELEIDGDPQARTPFRVLEGGTT